MKPASSRLMLGFTIFLTVFFALCFLVYWDLYFTSDYAMIGLMAKRLLEFGEQNIFVWRVGYLGTLVETNLIALAFRLFGIGPISLNLAPCLLFFVLVGVYFHYLSKNFSRETAILSTLLFVSSTPFLYGKLIRTQPNYTLIFLLGILFLGQFQKILNGNRSWKAGGVLGFLAGFGAYTYGQMFYFLGAAGLQLIFLYLSWFLRLPQNGHWIRVGIPPFSSKWLRALMGVNGIHFFFALLFWILDVQSLGNVRFGAFSMIQASVVILVLSHVAWSWKFLRNRLLSWRFSIALAIGFLIGFLPKLYYDWILKGERRVETMGLQPHFERIVQNLEYLWGAVLEFLNIGAIPILGNLVLAMAGIVGWIGVRGAWNQIRSAKFAVVPTIWWLWLSVPLLFLLSKAVYDPTSKRYFLAIVLVASLTVARVLQRVQISSPRLVVVLLGVGMLHSFVAFERKLSQSTRGADWKELVSILQANGVTLGYSHYWFAYAVNFLSNESIRLEPIHSNYSPHYEDAVREAKRIAYLDTLRSHYPVIDGIVKIRNHQYRVEKRILFEPSALEIHQDPMIEKRVREGGIQILILQQVPRASS